MFDQRRLPLGSVSCSPLRAGERGAIMVESLLVLPLYFTLVFFIAESVIVGYDFMAVQYIAAQSVRDAVVMKPGDDASAKDCLDKHGHDKCDGHHEHDDDHHHKVTKKNIKMKRYRKIEEEVDTLAGAYKQPELEKRICAGQPFALGVKIPDPTQCQTIDGGAPGELVYVEVKRNVSVLFQLLTFEISGQAVGRNEENALPNPVLALP